MLFTHADGLGHCKGNLRGKIHQNIRMSGFLGRKAVGAANAQNAVLMRCFNVKGAVAHHNRGRCVGFFYQILQGRCLVAAFFQRLLEMEEMLDTHGVEQNVDIVNVGVGAHRQRIALILQGLQSLGNAFVALGVLCCKRKLGICPQPPNIRESAPG